MLLFLYFLLNIYISAFSQFLHSCESIRSFKTKLKPYSALRGENVKGKKTRKERK